MKEITWEMVDNFCNEYDFYILHVWLAAIIHQDFNIQLLKKAIIAYSDKDFNACQKFIDKLFDEVNIDPDGIGNRL